MSSTTEQDTSPGDLDDDPTTTRLKQDIQQTRDDLSETVAALEEKLSPPQVREVVAAELQQVEERVRDVLGDNLDKARSLIQSELQEAKQVLRSGVADAERMIRSGLTDAKESAKTELQDAITGAKESVRAATLGRIETFATSVGDTMNDARDTLIDTIYQNPLPATLTGIGLAWLLMNRSKAASYRRRGQYGNGDGSWRSAGRADTMPGDLGAAAGRAAQRAGATVTEGVQGVTDAAGRALEGASGMVSSLAHSAGEGAQQAVQTMGDTATALAGNAQASVRRVEDTFKRQLSERPLAAGAAALAIGTMVGCSLPRTQTEDQWLGEARDSVLQRAGETVHQAAESVTKLAESTTQKKEDGEKQPDNRSSDARTERSDTVSSNPSAQRS